MLFLTKAIKKICYCIKLFFSLDLRVLEAQKEAKKLDDMIVRVIEIRIVNRPHCIVRFSENSDIYVGLDYTPFMGDDVILQFSPVANVELRDICYSEDFTDHVGSYLRGRQNTWNFENCERSVS